MSAMAIAALLAVGSGPPLPDVQLSAGLDWSTGTYGHPQTTTAATRSVALDLDFGSWMVGVAGAHAAIAGPADVALLDPSTEPRRRGRGARTGEERREGFTDLVLSAQWTPAPVDRPFWYSLAAGATLPTGDVDAGLGQPDSDYFVHADFGYDAGPLAAAASLGYRLTADPYWRNPVSVSISLTGTVGDRTVVGVGFDAAQSLAPGLAAQASASVFAGRPLGRLGQIDLYLWRGLNEASGDFGGGLALRRSFGAGR